MLKKRFHFLLLFLLVPLLLVACGGQAEQPSSESKLKVVATTTIVGDVVGQVGDNLIELSVLLPLGTDPHSFTSSPQDVAKVADADIVFANGAGLEEFLDNLIGSAGVADKVVHVSEGIDLLVFEGEEDHDHDGEDHEREDHEGEKHEGDEHRHEHTGGDPHTWTDPNNVKIWVQNIEQKLSEVDPANAETYAANAKAYTAELKNLDAWIREQVAQIPVENRKLVTDHNIFGYFVDEYGFEQVGALIPSYSSMAEPTAKELAEIEDAIKDLDVKAVFVGNTVNPLLAERVAVDTGVALAYVYTGSLSEIGGEASTYLEYMTYNTTIFVNAMK